MFCVSKAETRSMDNGQEALSLSQLLCGNFGTKDESESYTHSHMKVKVTVPAGGDAVCTKRKAAQDLVLSA